MPVRARSRKGRPIGQDAGEKSLSLIAPPVLKLKIKEGVVNKCYFGAAGVTGSSPVPDIGIAQLDRARYIVTYCFLPFFLEITLYVLCQTFNKK